jgi:MFS transporter, DHA2 family, multidrug resistance protein
MNTNDHQGSESVNAGEVSRAERREWIGLAVIALPVMALLLVLGPLLLPESRDTEAGRVDLLSAALSLISVLAVIYGLKQIAQEGMGWPPLLSILVGLVFGAIFVRRQRGLAELLIELRLSRASAFGASLATFALSVFVIAGIFLFIVQYLQLVFGLSPLVAGL